MKDFLIRGALKQIMRFVPREPGMSRQEHKLMTNSLIDSIIGFKNSPEGQKLFKEAEKGTLTRKVTEAEGNAFGRAFEKAMDKAERDAAKISRISTTATKSKGLAARAFSRLFKRK